MSALELGVLTQPENTATDPIAAKLGGSKSQHKRQEAQASPSGQTTPASTTTTPTTKTKKSRKPKSQTGIWIIEKSLDKKNWVAEAWVPTREAATKQIELCETLGGALGIHYRVTRYEPAR